MTLRSALTGFSTLLTTLATLSPISGLGAIALAAPFCASGLVAFAAITILAGHFIAGSAGLAAESDVVGPIGHAVTIPIAVLSIRDSVAVHIAILGVGNAIPVHVAFRAILSIAGQTGTIRTGIGPERIVVASIRRAVSIRIPVLAIGDSVTVHVIILGIGEAISVEIAIGPALAVIGNTRGAGTGVRRIAPAFAEDAGEGETHEVHLAGREIFPVPNGRIAHRFHLPLLLSCVFPFG